MSDTSELMAVFDQSTATADAIDALHDAGVADDQIVVMTGVPFPEGALGRHVAWSRLPYIVLVGALAGLVLGLSLAAITPHLYRLDVGGHPTVSFAPVAVITFVFTMMATIITTFVGVLWEMNFPEFGHKNYSTLVTEGQIAVLVEFPQSLEDKVQSVFQEHGGHHIHHPEKQQL